MRVMRAKDRGGGDVIIIRVKEEGDAKNVQRLSEP
jgi:hypothetical protein